MRNFDIKNWIWVLVLASTGMVTVLPVSATAKMIAVAFSIFGVLKCQTYFNFATANVKTNAWDRLAWFSAWPGLDARAFFGGNTTAIRPQLRDWITASAKTAIGGVLLLGVAPQLVDSHELIAGWIAMIGIVFLVHFGFLHLMALVWQQCGRNVRPIMDAPLAATSLSEFWGRRWNLAFRDFAHVSVFRPIAKRWNAKVATWVGFVFSGFVHELAISVPASAGFGLPMCYFLLQGLGVAIERRAIKSGIPVRGGLCCWLFAAVFIIPAAYWLFHPPFVDRVIVPLISYRT